MTITQYDVGKYLEDPFLFIEDLKKNRERGDSKLIFAKEPISDEYPKKEGISFILNKISKLEQLTTENIANALINYTSFMKKHKIQIIKKFDEDCQLSYKGEIPNINVKNFKTQSFYGFNKFQIINADTLDRKLKKDKIVLTGIDYTYALDSNAVSYFEQYCRNKDSKYKDLYDEILAYENNIDIAPYIFEIVMHGLRDFGINYKLNKKNKNDTQAGFFQNLTVLYKEGLFKEKLEKKFINNIVKGTNSLIKYHGIVGYTAKIFLILMLEAKIKFKKSSNKIKDYVYNEMRELKLPIENRFKVILYLFSENIGHSFFNKVRNLEDIDDIDDFMERKVDNTARDIALCFLDRYVYSHLDIFPFIASDDNGLLEMLKETKPDFIFKYGKLEVPVHSKINKDMQKKHLKFFETESVESMHLAEDIPLKEVMGIYEKKKKEFITVISNQAI